MLLSPASTHAKLPAKPATDTWSRIKRGQGGLGLSSQPQNPSLALARVRLVTLVYGEVETVRTVPISYEELKEAAREWLKPPTDASLTFRIPSEYLSLHAARAVEGPFIWVDSEDSYQIATLGVTSSRIEIISDGRDFLLPPVAPAPAPEAPMQNGDSVPAHRPSSKKVSSANIWSKIWKSRKDAAPKPDPQTRTPQPGKDSKIAPEPQAALTRRRLVTLVYEDMETVRMLPSSYHEMLDTARDWLKPPSTANLFLRVPVEYASVHASRFVQGPYIWIDSEDSYQIATHGVGSTRIEIIADAPPPDNFPIPVLEMPCSFTLELNEGEYLALDVTMSSKEQDMSRDETGGLIKGKFTGELNVVRDGANHKMEFVGALQQDPDHPEKAEDSPDESLPPPKQTIARCVVHILAPEQQYCELTAAFSPHWTFNLTWPEAERLNHDKFKYFLRLNSGGAMEHFDSETVTNALYYQATADSDVVDPHQYIAPHNGFAMPSREFIPLIVRILEQLGLSVPAQADFMSQNIDAFAAHKNVAFRLLSPIRVAAAIDLFITAEECIFTRFFLLFRGIKDEDLPIFAGKGEKEASAFDWKELVGVTEASSDPSKLRVIETSVCEVV
ncbi:hypothetical protein BD410DRAFT_744264 [Rickenella mellea]|uniref:Uncharacterized protein n=1 Tax=Rickenella mellea TaxID=50990 RepID=A0A4Y7QBQ5_9AGAM|nr:hypothetical protein BD410DRAFT_744264 [Rickenella mellea]